MAPRILLFDLGNIVIRVGFDELLRARNLFSESGQARRC